MNNPISLAVLLEHFFTQRLMQQRQASPHTINSYRDTFSQFLKFAEQRLEQAPSRLSFQNIDAPLITAFLDHLEKHQGISARSRNLRLTALRSFFRFAAFEAPAHSAQIQRVLAIPSKRFTRTLVQFLTRAEVDALLAAPDQTTWLGRRDHAFILLAVQTGTAFIRNDRAQTRRYYPRGRCAYTGNRKGSQRALYPFGQIYTRGIEGVATRASTR
jgi:site-specific recombinase XerD